jgi:hypothetical protein
LIIEAGFDSGIDSDKKDCSATTISIVLFKKLGWSFSTAWSLIRDWRGCQVKTAR